MTAVNHLKPGTPGMLLALLSDLDDQQLEEQAEYFAERIRDEQDPEKCELLILALAQCEERIVRRQLGRMT